MLIPLSSQLILLIMASCRHALKSLGGMLSPCLTPPYNQCKEKPSQEKVDVLGTPGYIYIYLFSIFDQGHVDIVDQVA